MARRPREEQVLYEMHVGTFTPEGTWEAAARELPELAELGHHRASSDAGRRFPGRFGWGYDGVDLFAPTRLYGRPDDLRRFVDRAHALGLGVILDVVYNHFGPDGNYLKRSRRPTSPTATTTSGARRSTSTGRMPGRCASSSSPTPATGSTSSTSTACGSTPRSRSSTPRTTTSWPRSCAGCARRRGGRATFIVGENEPQDARLVRPPKRGGYGLDALWNDDFHHSAMVALTGTTRPTTRTTAARRRSSSPPRNRAFLYQGQRYAWQKKRRGTPALDLPADRFVVFLQNHDQVANSARAARASR